VLDADRNLNVLVYVDASYGVHVDGKSHTSESTVRLCWNNHSRCSSTLVRKLTIEMLSDFCGLEALELNTLYSV